MVFKNRQQAGARLARELKEFAGSDNVIVLGIPRGGLVVAYEVAKALNVPLDVFLARKLGVPGQEELAFGAVALGGGRYLDREIIEAAHLSHDEIEAVTQATNRKLQERAQLYRGGRPPLSVKGKTVILVDDGIATGASIFAAINALRDMKPKALVVAAPVASRHTFNWLRRYADRFVVSYVSENFYAVGQFYDEFSQVSDSEVVELLEGARHQAKEGTTIGDCPGPDSREPPRTAHFSRHEIAIHAGEVTLDGTLCLPQNPKGIVLFAHGSGSSRYSLRNRYVADVLNSRGIATLLFDLLTKSEEGIDWYTSEFRFNIDLLSNRLMKVTQWIAENPATHDLKVAYFGASTGAAATFVAAASLPDRIVAIVSRGGRADLAGDALAKVRAASLLIVGSLDPQVVELNRQALTKLRCKDKQMIVIRGATHLFEEPGRLEHVAQIATDWIEHFFSYANAVKIPPLTGYRDARDRKAV